MSLLEIDSLSFSYTAGHPVLVDVSLDVNIAVRFLDAVEAATAQILAWPDSEHPYAGLEDRMPHVRAKRVRGFPYRIIYLVDSTEVVVLAYAHDKRRPDYWMRRVEDRPRLTVQGHGGAARVESSGKPGRGREARRRWRPSIPRTTTRSVAARPRGSASTSP